MTNEEGDRTFRHFRIKPPLRRMWVLERRTACRFETTVLPVLREYFCNPTKSA